MDDRHRTRIVLCWHAFHLESSGSLEWCGLGTTSGRTPDENDTSTSPPLPLTTIALEFPALDLSGTLNLLTRSSTIAPVKCMEVCLLHHRGTQLTLDVSAPAHW